MDWAAWGERLEAVLGPEGKGQFQGLFAPGAEFSDPVNPPTTDLAAIEQLTEDSFPDWSQEVIAIHGDDRGGAFEWIGRGSLGGAIAIEIRGCTMVEIDDAGLITRWRDYFDLKEIEDQVSAATAKS